VKGACAEIKRRAMIMSNWKLVCSKDADNVDYECTVESETEPDYLWCCEIAQKHGCKNFYTYEIQE